MDSPEGIRVNSMYYTFSMGVWGRGGMVLYQDFLLSNLKSKKNQRLEQNPLIEVTVNCMEKKKKSSLTNFVPITSKNWASGLCSVYCR